MPSQEDNWQRDAVQQSWVTQQLGTLATGPGLPDLQREAILLGQRFLALQIQSGLKGALRLL